MLKILVTILNATTNIKEGGLYDDLITQWIFTLALPMTISRNYEEIDYGLDQDLLHISH